MTPISPARADEILDALRRGTVPESALEAFAVGLEPYRDTLLGELKQAATGRGRFKAVRGDYGTGKTFFARWFQGLARAEGFATAEVQISEAETPLHRLETVYRRLVEHLMTEGGPRGAMRSIIDGWFYALEEEVLAREVDCSEAQLLQATEALMVERLRPIERQAPAFGACLRTYRRSVAAGDEALASGLIAWMSGQPNVAASVKRAAGIKGDIDHFGALGFLQGLLLILRDSGFSGLVLVLDEVETLQRVRGDIREKSFNALRQLMDEIDAGRFPGLYLMITGTPAFFDGPQGVQRLPPLAQRLHVDFGADQRFDNPRAVQIRLQPFDMARLVEVGRNVRSVFLQRGRATDRLQLLADDALLAELAAAVTGKLGGKVGVAPRIFLKKLVAEVLDRIDQFPDFDPRRDYQLMVQASELSLDERRALSPDDIQLDL
ncbi:BREX system ATP-binding protein BrxD [Luteimonas sp. MC1572]|uniref:BREX system ATP-binding protein BrxD n=1 Tax=Luteimonas sp. MC1572 TaxID=2799325 RepID=UPI0018F07FB9|nr:BREX system ATP-binding protein BrxD [Luteimonas sp. MC1572]MBJ6982004.1 BREX system ATP-binding protein BrxD [Luteimonas sp. MC1572]QQO03303.1 BREX system ATP-binding protein BrxD [Luteimonas sp. MC1572]